MRLDMPSASMSEPITWITDPLSLLWYELQNGALNSRVMQLDSANLPVRDTRAR